jgi:aspartate/methionine/tyrosine aminotransferase
MAVPAHLYDAVRKVQDTVLICPPVVSQHAAAGALGAGRRYCAAHLGAIARVRQALLAEMRGLPCHAPPADGAFYLFATVDVRMGPMDLVERLIREHGVAVIPGTTFGVEGRCAIRISYGALRPETALEGVGRLVRGIKQIARA